LILSLLVAAWIWGRVLTDCQGGPEIVTHYHLMATCLVVALTVCTDAQGQPFVCPETIHAPPIPLAFEVPDPGIGTEVRTEMDPVSMPDLLPLPPLDGVTAWPWPSPENPYPVVAVDWAGNRSGPCP
jgi:hypothetical protein